MASCSEILGRICPSEGLGRLSTARLMSSGVMFIQSGLPFKNCAMGPDWAVRNCQAGISWSMLSRWLLKSISRSSYWGRSKKTLLHSLLVRYREKNVDIRYDIQFRRSLYIWYVFDIKVLIRYWVQYRIVISGYKDISYLNTGDLVMIYLMSVEYAFGLSLVFCSNFCLDSASDASVVVGPGAEPAGPAATDWHCWATAAWGLQTDDLASRSHEVMPSNRQ